jgi:lipid-A-disaccharide synthase
MSKKVFMISGEESGDLHGAKLIEALKTHSPDLVVKGMGGERMRRAGLVGLDSRNLSVVGIIEVVEKAPGILKAYRGLKSLLKGDHFDAIILIDFPDFNLRFASLAKGLGIPVIYYISPQIWAWRKNRINKIARLVDKMLVVFPFEVDLYKDAGVDVEYVGHPLMDTAYSPLTKEEARSRLALDERDNVITLLPGSRTAEVRRLLPPMLDAAALIEEGLAEPVRFIICAANSIDDAELDRLIDAGPSSVKVVRNDMYTALRASDAAITASGTATLETALIGAPMVIVYRVSAITYQIAKWLVGVKEIGLPNIVAPKSFIKELVQEDATPENIADEILQILKDSGKRNAMMRAYEDIRASLGDGSPADKAAAAVMSVISKTSRSAGDRQRG